MTLRDNRDKILAELAQTEAEIDISLPRKKC